MWGKCYLGQENRVRYVNQDPGSRSTRIHFPTAKLDMAVMTAPLGKQLPASVTLVPLDTQVYRVHVYFEVLLLARPEERLPARAAKERVCGAC